MCPYSLWDTSSWSAGSFGNSFGLSGKHFKGHSQWLAPITILLLLRILSLIFFLMTWLALFSVSLIYKKFFQKEMFWSFDMPALTLFPGSIFFLVLLERFRMNSPSLPPRRNLEVTVSSVTSIFPLLKKIPYFLKKCRNSVSEISQFWFA